MEGYLEVWGMSGPSLVPLDTDHLAIGRDADNDVALPQDRTVSNLHAVLERFRTGWCVRDLGSLNGTFVNGQRVLGEHRLHVGDEVQVGETRLVFRSDRSPAQSETIGQAGPPALTRREHDVLVALCLPLASGDTFSQPATVKDIAARLYVSEAAVKAHLLNLYEKFDLHDTELPRRVLLAREAVRRRAVTLDELRGS